MPDPSCPRCNETAAEQANYCSACGWSLTLPESDAAPAAIEGPVAQAPSPMLPAIRRDLAPLIAPFAPALRRTAAVIAAAAAADWAARRAVPALAASAVRRVAKPAERVVLEETITIRHRVTTRS